jgi:hypothetical protein
VKNKSDNVVCLEVERSAINDAVCWCYWNVTLQPGEETEDTINWYMSSIKPQFIEDVDKIYIEFTGYQENFYGSNYFQEEPSVYYPHGEENYSKPERQESTLIFEENGCRMYYLGSGWSDSYGGYLMSVCVENDTDTTVDFDMDDTSVNGTAVTNYWGEVVPAGCREYSYILWDEEDLKYVDTVEKVELKIQVWQWDNYNAGYLVDGEFTVIP